MKKTVLFFVIITLIVSLLPMSFASEGPMVDPIKHSGNDANNIDALAPDGYVYYKLDTGEVGTYTLRFDGAGQIATDGEIVVNVEISDSGSGYTRVSWDSNVNLYSFIVKAGNGYNEYRYYEQYSADANLISPKNKGGNIADVSHVSFVFNPIPKDTPPEYDISLGNIKYAYIFGHEPEFRSLGEGLGYEAVLNMDMDGPVQIEQVSAMIIRLIDQKYDLQDSQFALDPKIQAYEGSWFERGLAYMASAGTFDDVGAVRLGNATRADVAKLLTKGLKLKNRKATPYTDVEGHENLAYIEAMYDFGYMLGTSPTTFSPDKVMTRAEFCTLMNRITGRDSYGLEALDENGVPYTISKDTYYFTDMNDPTHWAYEECLKATSFYNEDGYIDVIQRQQRIRNILDQYEGQLVY